MQPPNNAAPSTPPPSADDRARAEYERGWRQAMAEVAIAIPCDADTIYKNELWHLNMRQRIDAATKPLESEIARLRGEVDGVRQAAAVRRTVLHDTIARLTRERDEALAALDWLDKQYVVVREPLPHGTRECFSHMAFDEEGQRIDSHISEKIAAARKERG